MNITANAVDQINKDRQKTVESTAIRHINNITSYQASIKLSEERIKNNQEAANKLALDVLDYNKVVGVNAPAAPNDNQATIIRAIAESNKAKQVNVEAQSQSFILQIENERKNIKSLNEGIAKEREALSKLAVDVVSVDTVVGK